MQYFCKGTSDFSIIGVVVDGELISIKKLIGQSISVLKDMKDAYYSYDGKMFDICVKDNDDVYDLTTLWTKIESSMRSRVINSLIPMDGIDSAEATNVKTAIAGFVSKALTPSTGVTLEQFNRAVLDRIEFEKSNEESAVFSENTGVLKLETLRANTASNVNTEIDKFISEHRSCVNQVIESEEQEVMFYIDDGRVTPAYDDVCDINEDTVDKYKLKYLVPAYHKYIGGYVNYVQGNKGSDISTYADRDYITDNHCAAILNDVHYHDVLRDETAANTLKCNIGNNMTKITHEYIEGSDEYDADDIRPNEREYYDALCQFIDECQSRDILEATINEWRDAGLDLTQFIPGITQREVSLRQYDRNSMTILGEEGGKFSDEFNALSVEELQHNAEIDRRYQEKLDKYGFNTDTLNKYGLTHEYLTANVVGSPTSLKWFRYAINMALVATRAYTGKVRVPYGYDASEFMRYLNVNKISFDGKYSALTKEHIRFTEAGAAQLLNEDDPKLSLLFAGSGFEDFTIINEDGNEVNGELDIDAYWKGHKICAQGLRVLKNSSGEVADAVKPEFIFDTDADMLKSSDIKKMDNSTRDSLVDIIIANCLSSHNKYAFAEALIKCLRFGSNKPRNLCIGGLSSKVNLTTGEIIEGINYDKPVLKDGKKYVMRYIVTSNGISKDSFNFLKMGTKCSAQRDIIVGVGLGEYYEKETGSGVNEVVTFYDMEMFTKKKELHGDIYGFNNGEIATNTGLLEGISLEKMTSMVKNNAVKYRVEMNDSIFQNVISRYISEIGDNKTLAHQKISKMNKDGYGLFDMFSMLSSMNGINVAVEYIVRNAVIDGFKKLNGKGSIGIIQNIVVLDTFRLYGNVVAQCYAIESTSVNSAFRESFNIWNTTVDYSMTVATSTQKTTDVKDKYKELLADKLGNFKYTVYYLVEKKATGESNRLFYMLQCKESEYKSRYVILSCDLYRVDDVMQYSETDKTKDVPVPAFFNKLDALAKSKEWTLEKASVAMTAFLDDVSKTRFNTILRSKVNM